MTLLLASGELDARRTVAQSSLAALSSSLASDLERVLGAPVFVPEQKAMLSRDGVRCPKDGTMLDFDPHSPKVHRCPRCGSDYRGERRDRFWVYWYQLWLAERAVHGATLGALTDAKDARDFAIAVLDAYCHRYPGYPNSDNVLGPTRPFFSTYIESIWLLQLCVAADIVESQAPSPVIDRFRDAVVEPSLRLIESFDERLSNRQVWNNAALIAGNRLLGHDDRAEAIVWAESGVVAHLTKALLPDGTWYEGENYHFFAHRGLWYCMELAKRMSSRVPDDLVRRYDAGFRAPFLTALPDLTFPSRRDSQYAVSLRQWRFAESCELGLARADDRVLQGMLSRLYADDLSRGDTGRWKSTGEAERNVPPTRLDRSDLGWKSLLFARESVPLSGSSPGSVLLEKQGYGMIRRDNGKVYVALDYGVSGGDHGHPDRLNLLVVNGDRRILDDMGTGSYVDPSLHWYRSTLAHNAPMFDGRSQTRVDGELIAFEDRGGAGWISAGASIAPGARATRTVVVMPDYLLDEVRWSAGEDRIFDLPLHFDIEARDGQTPSEDLIGSDGTEDGFRFLRGVRCVACVAPGAIARFHTRDGQLWIATDTPVDVWKAIAPGAPGAGDGSLVVLRSRASAGTIRWAWSWAGTPRLIALFPQPVIEAGGARHEHARAEHGWNIAIHVGGARSTIDLQGVVQRPPDTPGSEPPAPVHLDAGTALKTGSVREFSLGEQHYRRSEQTWLEAGSPNAHVTLRRDGDWLRLTVTANAERTFAAPEGENPLDNERADINGAGVQLYLRTDDRKAGYVIVPLQSGSDLSVRPVDQWGAEIPVEGSWHPTAGGYRIDLRFQPAADLLMLDLIVNEKPAGRDRRRGQLVLSGAAGEFVYLRGDRHEASRLIPFALSR